MVGRAAAYLYAALAAVVIAFQLALAAGLPWGEYAMGGAFPGQFPPALRVAAVRQAMLIGATGAVVLSRAGVITHWSRLSRRLIWVVVALMAISAVMNLATPSAAERAIWGPIALLLLATSLMVALSRR